MATINLLPGELNIVVSMTNDFSLLLDFDIVLTGYTFTAKVSAEGMGTLTTITVTNTSLATGQITLSLADTVLATIGRGDHSWYLQWATDTSVDRRVLEGDFKIK
mgnify:CR=1 FL=1